MFTKEAVAADVANEALTAFRTYDAVCVNEADAANDAVPNKDPVIVFPNAVGPAK